MELAKKNLAIDLKKFNRNLETFISSSIFLLNKLMQFIIKRKGKQFRPILCFLSAHICGKVSESIYRAAACIEIIHTATLIHDDVVDNAMQRRGFFSINAIWKNKIAVLAGDYLLAKGLLVALQHKEYLILETLSDVVKQMSEAELLQLEKSKKASTDESIYFEIIKGKTGILIEACCVLGAMLQEKTNPKYIQAMKIIGENIGLAFQIKDDLLDYSTNFIGKPRAQDIKEKKLTLPLLYTLKKCNPEQKKKILNIIKNHNKDNAKIKEVLKMCHDIGGIKETYLKLQEIKNIALTQLNIFADTPHKKAMVQLIKNI